MKNVIGILCIFIICSLIIPNSGVMADMDKIATWDSVNTELDVFRYRYYLFVFGFFEDFIKNDEDGYIHYQINFTSVFYFSFYKINIRIWRFEIGHSGLTIWGLGGVNFYGILDESKGLICGFFLE
jgi:hypothetical protein